MAPGKTAFVSRQEERKNRKSAVFLNSLNLMFSFSYLCSQSISLCLDVYISNYRGEAIFYFDTWGVPPPQGTIWKFSSIHHKSWAGLEHFFLGHSRVRGGTGLMNQR